jgi:hypothetical protein
LVVLLCSRVLAVETLIVVMAVRQSVEMVVDIQPLQHLLLLILHLVVVLQTQTDRQTSIFFLLVAVVAVLFMFVGERDVLFCKS